MRQAEGVYSLSGSHRPMTFARNKKEDGDKLSFSDTIPKDTELYRLMSTTPGEGE